MKRTIIVDGSNLLHRTYWVSSVRRTISVEQLFLNSIKKLGEQFKFDEYICVWDSRQIRGVKNYRTENVEYKQTRDREKSKKVFSHEPACVELTSSLGIKNLSPGVLEADDYIAWLSREASLESSVIISSDGDLIQLVSPNCCVYNPVKDVIIDHDNFTDMTSVSSVEKYILYKAVVGDKSDNIAGVPGIGTKRAFNIIRSGLASLSKDNCEIVEHNIQLIDLAVGLEKHPDERGIYEDTYARVTNNTKVNMKEFSKLCRQYKLEHTLKNIPSWERCFDKTKSPEAVVTNLIKLLG